MSEAKLTLETVRTWTRAGLTRTEAGEVLGLDPRTVTEGIKNGTIPAIKIGRRVIIPRERFLALFDATSAAEVA